MPTDRQSLQPVHRRFEVRLGAAILAVWTTAVVAGTLQPTPGRARETTPRSTAAPNLRPALALVLLQPLRLATLDLRPPAGDGLEAAPFVLRTRDMAERARAVQCLANAVYYEAALEPLEGQRAVAQVVLNRVRNPAFPNSVCGVVYQGWERGFGCQFSFTCDGALSRRPAQGAYARARAVAEQALDGHVVEEVGAATHYHAVSVAPWWRLAMVRVARLGGHVFYRWPGAAEISGRSKQAYGGGELSIPQAVIDGHASHAAPAEPEIEASPTPKLVQATFTATAVEGGAS